MTAEALSAADAIFSAYDKAESDAARKSWKRRNLAD